MTSSGQMGRMFRRLTIQEQSWLLICRECGAATLYEKRYEHAKFHELINGMDETLNKTAGEVQDVLPPF